MAARRGKTARIASSAAVGLAAFLVSLTAFAQEYLVAVGTQRMVRVEYSIGRSAVGSSEIADYKILENRREILITGKEAGETTLTLWDQQGLLKNEFRIRVRPSAGSANQIIDEMKQLLGGIEGITFKAVGRNVWLEGEVLTARDMDRIKTVLESYPEVKSLVNMSPVTQEMLDVATAEGVKTVQLTLTIMEIDKNLSRQLGVKWGGSVSPQTSAPLQIPGAPFLGPITGVVKDILPQLNFMTSSGKSRVLASPTLITQSGKEADLFVGGELPIPVAQGGGAISIEYKEYGVKLKFLPEVDTQNNINTAINMEMSSLGGPSAGGAPGILTNRVNTNVFVREGESITLGGLVQSTDAQAVDKIPGLGNIPVLGNLFKSRSFIKNETEFLVFATPKLIRSASEAGAELKDKVQGDFEEFSEIGQKKKKKK